MMMFIIIIIIFIIIIIIIIILFLFISILFFLFPLMALLFEANISANKISFIMECDRGRTTAKKTTRSHQKTQKYIKGKSSVYLFHGNKVKYNDT